MTRFYKQKLLLIRGDDATAFSATDAAVGKGVEIEPVVGDRASRELERPYFGAQEEFLTNQHQTIKFALEYAAGGDAGDSQKWSTLLKACAFAQTIVASTSDTYTPVTTGVVPCKIGFQQSGKLHTLSGAKGSVSFDLTANAIPMMTFTMTGKWNLPVDLVTALKGDFSGWPHPQIVTRTNTPTVSVFGVTDLPMTSLKLDANTVVVHRSPANANPMVLVTDRAASAELVVDATAWDVFAKAVDNTDAGRGAVQAVHGKVGGRQITLDLPRCRIGEPKYQDDNGVAQYTVPLQVLPGATGNDEFSIAVT